VTVQSVSGYYGSSNKYFIDGTQQATISLVRGKTYTFNNNASGSHPMYITTSSDGTLYVGCDEWRYIVSHVRGPPKRSKYTLL